MALSKIWAAFIIISIVVAGVRYAFLPADREIFGQMVTGKAGDTVRLPAPAAVGAPTVGAPAAGPTVAPASVVGAGGMTASVGMGRRPTPCKGRTA